MASPGSKRKRCSSSPVTSPEPKKGRLGQILSYLTPSKGAGREEQKKKRLSFGAPVVHSFDAFSPPCRWRPLHDNASLDAGTLPKGAYTTCAPRAHSRAARALAGSAPRARILVHCVASRTTRCTCRPPRSARRALKDLL